LARDDCKDDADDDADQRYDIPDAKGHLKIPLTDEVESQKHTGCDDENAQQGKQHSDEVPNVPHPHIVARNVGVSENPDRATATEPASGFIEGFFSAKREGISLVHEDRLVAQKDGDPGAIPIQRISSRSSAFDEE